MKASLVLASLLWLAPSLSRADAVPGDSACHRWEHWEGAHYGRCVMGPHCSVAAPGASRASGSLAIVGLVVILASRRRIGGFG